MKIAVACLFLCCATTGWMGAATGAESTGSTVEQIVERAVRAGAQVSEYTAQEERFDLFEQDGQKNAQASRSSQTVAFRAPDRLWSVAKLGGQTYLSVADGTTYYTFSTVRPQEILAEGVAERVPGRLKSYPQVSIPRYSPLLGQLYDLTKVYGQATASTYQGRELIEGVVCDIIEFTVPFSAATWSQARASHPELPATPGPVRHRYALGVDDGLIRRYLAVSEIPAVSTCWKEQRYTIKASDAAEQFTLERLQVAVKPFTTGRPAPKVQSAYNEIGQPLPVLKAVRTDGQPLRWQDYHGKVVVLETWASWCGACKAAMPFYEKTRAQLQDREVVFIALNFDAEQADYQRWMAGNQKKYGFLFARATITPQNAQDVMKDFKGGLPVFYVVGRDGKVVAAYSGFGGSTGSEDPRLIAGLQKAGVEPSK